MPQGTVSCQVLIWSHDLMHNQSIMFDNVVVTAQITDTDGDGVDDDSDPATGKYYQTINNLPWAIDLPVKFDYAIEQTEIVEAYNYFRSWAESGGTKNEDWYEDNTGYRNNQYIYSPPQ